MMMDMIYFFATGCATIIIVFLLVGIMYIRSS